MHGVDPYGRDRALSALPEFRKATFLSSRFMNVAFLNFRGTPAYQRNAALRASCACCSPSATGPLADDAA
jgi:hypothetical protein